MHVRTPTGKDMRGQVAQRRLDWRGTEFFVLTDGAGEFRPNRGDVLTYYADKPKSPEGIDAKTRRAAFVIHGRLRQQRNALAITVAMMALAFAATLVF